LLILEIRRLHYVKTNRKTVVETSMTQSKAHMELNNNKQRLLEERVAELERLLAERDDMLQDLSSQLDKYRSIMPLACNNPFVGGVAQNIISCNGSSAVDKPEMATNGQTRKHRTPGVSGETQHVPRNLDDLERVTLKTYHKTQRSGLLQRILTDKWRQIRTMAWHRSLIEKFTHVPSVVC
jgi:hypothetical protein